MRRFTAVAVTVVALFGAVTPAFAQAPAPKVTINGLVDFVTTAYKNWSATGAGCAAGAGSATTTNNCDVTDSRDKGWYSRERGVFTITGEVGRAKGVWAIELDFTNGQIGAASSANGISGTSSSFDLDTDVAGFVETKWLYLEAPITGAGSVMPFIPVSTVMRAGAQPARGHEYKVGILFGGDFPGVTLESTWAPNLRSTVTYAQIGEQMDPVTRGSGTQGGPLVTNEDWALLASVEMDVFKGLTVKPTYAFAQYTCGNGGSLGLGTEPKNGFGPTVGCVGSGGNRDLHRHTFGGDVRWTSGPFTVQPTFLYQVGDQEIATGREVDVRSWIFDTTAGFRTGPLNIEARVMWTPGMEAQHQVANGADVGYYQSINPAFAYMAGWTDIQTSGVDYITALLAGAPGVSLRTSPSYDKYGRRFFALAADYSLTPALTLKGLINTSWTDEKVDTDGTVTAVGITSPSRGDDRYLGTELNAGLTYRFAPNVAFDTIFAYMFTGSAMDQTIRGSRQDAQDIYKATARVRFTF